MKILASTIAAAAIFTSAGAAAASVQVQLWNFTSAGSQLSANETTYAGLGSASYTFTYSGPIDWSTSAATNTFLDFIGVANEPFVSGLSLVQDAALDATKLSSSGAANQSFFRITGNYYSSGPGTGTITHDDGAGIFFDGLKIDAMTTNQEGWTSSVVGTFNKPSLGNHTFALDYVEGNGSPSVLRFAGGAVPEPTTWAMMLVGFTGLGAILRRRRMSAFAA